MEACLKKSAVSFQAGEKPMYETTYNNITAVYVPDKSTTMTNTGRPATHDVMKLDEQNDGKGHLLCGQIRCVPRNHDK